MAITSIGLDADDTLWHSENHFTVTEERFRDLLEPWLPSDQVASRLIEREHDNLRIFGYGIKGFTLSMVETAIEVSGGTIDARTINEIIGWGKAMLSHPVELLPGVGDTIEQLRSSGYRLVLITKGDLFHQETKIAESGLAEHFDGIEILSEKSPAIYGRVLRRYEIAPADFVMVGNSVRSDVLPVIELGGHGVHIPYAVTWAHEHVEPDPSMDFPVLESISQLPTTVAGLSPRPDARA